MNRQSKISITSATCSISSQLQRRQGAPFGTVDMYVGGQKLFAWEEGVSFFLNPLVSVLEYILLISTRELQAGTADEVKTEMLVNDKNAVNFAASDCLDGASYHVIGFAQQIVLYWKLDENWGRNRNNRNLVNIAIGDRSDVEFVVHSYAAVINDLANRTTVGDGI